MRLGCEIARAALVAAVLSVGGPARSADPPAPAPPAAPAAAPPAAPATVTAPVPTVTAHAEYPAEERAAGREARVVVLATVDREGVVTAVEITASAGPRFDEAALAAARKWRFSPARDAIGPIESRVTIPFRFTLHHAGATTPQPAQTPAPAPAPPAPVAVAAPPLPTAPEVAVTAARYESNVAGRKGPQRSTSDFTVERDILSASVQHHQSAGDLLGTAPGVYVARPEGDAVAHQIYLRGFDAEHGQDIELTVGAVPMNQPSHLHGQGYADLNLIIPEVVRSLRVIEGVYDPRQGDFAVAGSIDFDLGVAQRGFQSHTSYGSFNTVRQLALWAPRGQAEETFAAVSIRKSDGYGTNRGSLSGALNGQYAFTTGNLRGLVHVAAYGGRANLAGVLRRDDVEAGRVGFYDSYPDPTANAQSALSIRAQAALSLEHRASWGARTGFSLYAMYSDFRWRANFTGYLERSRENPEWVGRGDLMEQENRDVSLGTRLHHRTRRFLPAKWLGALFEVGATYRLSLVDQAQNLLQAPDNQTWDKRVDASVRAHDLGLYADADLRLTKYVRLRGGVRADVLAYDVDDRLANFIPSFMRQTYFRGFRRTASGVAWGPRVTLEVEPLRWLTLMASYGEGYRSPQARLLEEGENAPFAKVRSVEGGARVRLFDDRLAVTAAGYGTFLSSDLAFDPGEGRAEPIGPTKRAGVVGYAIARPWPWLVGSLSVTWVNATLEAPPPATPTNPAPPFTPGQLLPYVPPVVIRADLGFNKEVVRKLWRGPLSVRAGAGFTYLSSRPLPYGQSADPVYLLDGSVGLRWWFIELNVEAFNLIGQQYAAVEYSYASWWGKTPVPSRVPARHLAAGPPRTILATLGFHF
jgi:TonB family protein